MPGTEPNNITGRRKGPPKGSRAACEAAGWQFTPLVSINSGEHGRGLPRRYGYRGVLVVPPAGSGIEPQQFEGAGRALAWAVEQSAEMMSRAPEQAPAGMTAIRLAIGATLVTGTMSEGADATPASPDAEMLSICADVLAASQTVRDLDTAEAKLSRDGVSYNDPQVLTLRAATQAAIKARDTGLELLPKLHATTREGLLQKARASMVVHWSGVYPASFRDELAYSLQVDMLHLIPSLPDPRQAVGDRPHGSAEGVA